MYLRVLWAFGIFFGGMISMIVCAFVLGLFQAPVRVLKRAIVQLFMSIVVLATCGIILWPPQNLFNSFWVAVALAAIFSWLQIWWFQRHLQGTVLRFKRPKNLIIGVTVGISGAIANTAVLFLGLKPTTIPAWIWFSVCLSFFLFSIFWIGWILRLEKKLGAPIMEQEKSSDT